MPTQPNAEDLALLQKLEQQFVTLREVARREGRPLLVTSQRDGTLVTELVQEEEHTSPAQQIPLSETSLRRGLERLLRRAKRQLRELSKEATNRNHEPDIDALRSERWVHDEYVRLIEGLLSEREPMDSVLRERLVEVIWDLREQRDGFERDRKLSTHPRSEHLERLRDITHGTVLRLEGIIKETRPPRAPERPPAPAMREENFHIGGQPLTPAQARNLILAVENVLIRERARVLTAVASSENDRHQDDCDHLCGVISVLRQAFGLDPEGIVYGHGGNAISDVQSVNEADEVRDEEEI